MAPCFEHFVNGGWFVLTTHDMPAAIRNGARNTATIRIRAKSIQALYNGELVSEMPGDDANLRAGRNEIGGVPVVGLMVDVLSTGIVYKMELIEVTGHGHWVTEPPAKQR